MERQQFREYQQDLFTQRGEDSLCPSTTCEAVSVAEVVKALQVEQAGENGRALAQDLMGAVLCHSNISQAYKQVKRNKLSKTISDKVLLGLIRKYLQSGIMVDGVISQRIEGTPQGSPLSPLLSNIVLDELDKELESRGHKFVRFADDCNIYVRSQEAGERVLKSISNFIECKLKLIVNNEKSKVCEVNQTKFLGYTLQKGGILTIAHKSINRFKTKVRKITKRNRGVSVDEIISELTPLMRGWLNYFRYARCRWLLRNLDGWIRRKLRCFRIKQCKRVITLQRFLKSRGVETWQSWIIALSDKGLWRKSGCPQVHQAMGNRWFYEEAGLYNLSLNYERLNN